VKVISLWQPWATFMAIGEKEIETRGKRTHHRGPLAIHAARRWEADQVEFCRSWIPAQILARTGYTYLGGTNLPLGAIVAVVELVDCIPISDPAQCGFDWLSDRTISDTEKALGNYSPGRFAWLTTNLRQIHPPIPYRGAQWLFDIEEAIINGALSGSP